MVLGDAEATVCNILFIIYYIFKNSAQRHTIISILMLSDEKKLQIQPAKHSSNQNGSFEQTAHVAVSRIRIR